MTRSLPAVADRSRRILRRAAVNHVQRGQRRLVREALGVLELVMRRSDLDPQRWRVVEVSVHHTLPEAEHLREVVAVQQRSWEREVVMRVCVAVELVDDEAVEQMSMLLSWGHRLDEAGVPSDEQTWLWSGGVRDRFDEHCEPFVDAASLAEARAALEGEGRGQGGLLVGV